MVATHPFFRATSFMNAARRLPSGAPPAHHPNCRGRARHLPSRFTPMRNFRLTLSYDGTDFHGWQTQPGLRTVQHTLEDALERLTREPRVRVSASGRTDTGVHAVGQVVNFHSPTRLEPRVLLRAVNAHLPEDVV